MRMMNKRGSFIKRSNTIRKSPSTVDGVLHHINYGGTTLDLSCIGYDHYACITVFETVDANGVRNGYRFDFVYDEIDQNGNPIMEDKDDNSNCGSIADLINSSRMKKSVNALVKTVSQNVIESIENVNPDSYDQCRLKMRFFDTETEFIESHSLVNPNIDSVKRIVRYFADNHENFYAENSEIDFHVQFFKERFIFHCVRIEYLCLRFELGEKPLINAEEFSLISPMKIYVRESHRERVK